MHADVADLGFVAVLAIFDDANLLDRLMAADAGPLMVKVN
jgi:hypothetical protein